MGELCPWLCLAINSHQHIVYIFFCCWYYPAPLSSPTHSFLCLLPWRPRVHQWFLPLSNKQIGCIIVYQSAIAFILQPSIINNCLCVSQPPASSTVQLLNSDSSPSCHTYWPHPAACDLVWEAVTALECLFQVKTRGEECNEGRDGGRKGTRGKWANPEWKQTGWIRLLGDWRLAIRLNWLQLGSL